MKRKLSGLIKSNLSIITKKILIISIIFTLFFIISSLAFSLSTTSSPWPMFRHDPQHTGRSPYKGNEINMFKWKFSIRSNEWSGNIDSSPAIGSDGTIYVLADSFCGPLGVTPCECLWAINPNGTLKWKGKIKVPTYSSPAIGSNGTIYVGSDGTLYAINPNGKLKWKLETEGWIYSSPTIGSDGTIYVGIGGRPGNLYAINPSGTLKWKLKTEGKIGPSPAIGSDGTIYVGSDDGNFYAINPNGTLKWKLGTGDMVESSPAIGSDGTIYVGRGNNLYAINPNGTLKWKLGTGGIGYSSPAIGSDGTIYIGLGYRLQISLEPSGYLAAINPNGTSKWTLKIEPVDSPPTIGSDGTIYIGSTIYNGWRYLYAINPNGSIVKRFTIEGSFAVPPSHSSSPVIGSDGTIYIGSNDGNLCAISGPVSSPQVSTTTNEDKIEKEITFKTFNYKDDYAEYSIKYPDWPNIPKAKFTHPGLKKSLDVGYSKEVRVHIIISQDFDLMDLFKFLREVPEDLEREAMKRGKTIEFYMGSTQIIKDEKTDNGNFMELLLDLDGEFFKKDKEDINAFLNSSKIHVLFKDFYCKENNKYFSVSVTVAEDKWSKYQNIAKSIINSMKVIKITDSSPQVSETTCSLTGSLHCPDKGGYPCDSCSSASGYINHFKGFNVLTTDEDCYVKLIYNDGDYIGNHNNCEVTIKGEKWLGLENESGTELVEEINKGHFDFTRANKFIERTMNFPEDGYNYEFANNGKEFRLYISRNREEAFKAVPWKNITIEIKNEETDKVFKYKFQKGIFPQTYSWSNGGVANYGQCVWWTAKRWVEEVDSKTLFPFYPIFPEVVNVKIIDSNYQPKKYDVLINYDPNNVSELGHYGFVEKVDGDKMYISQFNWIKPGEVYNYIIRTWNGNATNLFYSYNPSDRYYFKYYYRK